MWRRDKNSGVLAALAESGDQFQDDEILSQVPAWRRGRIRRQAEAARISGTPIGGYQPDWLSESDELDEMQYGDGFEYQTALNGLDGWSQGRADDYPDEAA